MTIVLLGLAFGFVVSVIAGLASIWIGHAEIELDLEDTPLAAEASHAGARAIRDGFRLIAFGVLGLTVVIAASL